MPSLIPLKLSRGDSIGVIAPSDPIAPEFEGRLQDGQEVLESMGFRVKFGEFIHSDSLDNVASLLEKAQDIHTILSEPQINAVLRAQGGSTANAMLHLLDWELLRSNPKIFMGLSDITVLLNAIYQKTGLVTFHGGDLLWSFGNDLPDYEREAFT